MAKSTIVRTWLGGLIALGAGLLLVGLSIVLMLAYGGTFNPAQSGNGYDFVPTTDGFFWLTVAGIVAGGILAFTGGIVQLVAWVGALVQTYSLPDKTWFAVLLIGGLIGLAMGIVGLITMAVYVIAGPESASIRAQVPAANPKATAVAPTA